MFKHLKIKKRFECKISLLFYVFSTTNFCFNLIFSHQDHACIDHLFGLINKDNKKKFEYYSIRLIEITSKLEPRVQILKKPLLSLGWRGKFEFNLLFES